MRLSHLHLLHLFVLDAVHRTLTQESSVSVILGGRDGAKLLFSLAGTVIGVVVYTGKETRSVLNTSFAKNKVNTHLKLLQKHLKAISCNTKSNLKNLH